jgi:hypothetical protein
MPKINGTLPAPDSGQPASAGASRAPRVVGWLSLGGVSLIAGIASYFHALSVVQAAGATAPVSYLVPALADLVILGASADLLAASRARADRPVLTMLALGVGIVVTLAMNVAAGSHHGIGGRLVAGWPAAAFTLALESLAGLVRRGRGAPVQTPGTVTVEVPVGCGHGVAETRDERIVEAYVHLRDCLGASPSYRDLGRAFGIHHDSAATLVKVALNGSAEPSQNEGPDAAPEPPGGQP